MPQSAEQGDENKKTANLQDEEAAPSSDLATALSELDEEEAEPDSNSEEQTDEESAEEAETPEEEVAEEEDLPDEAAVKRFLEKNGYVAYSREAIEKAQQEQGKKVGQADDEDDSEELAELQFTDPAEYQRRIVAKATKSVEESVAIRNQLIEDLRTEVPELDDEDLTVVRKNLAGLTLEQLKGVQATRSHISSGQAYGYAKIKNGVSKAVTPSKKQPAQDKKITKRPERKPDSEESVSTERAAAAEKIAKGLARRGITVDASKIARGGK